MSNPEADFAYFFINDEESDQLCMDLNDSAIEEIISLDEEINSNVVADTICKNVFYYEEDELMSDEDEELCKNVCLPIITDEIPITMDETPMITDETPMMTDEDDEICMHVDVPGYLYYSIPAEFDLEFPSVGEEFTQTTVFSTLKSSQSAEEISSFPEHGKWIESSPETQAPQQGGGLRRDTSNSSSNIDDIYTQEEEGEEDQINETTDPFVQFEVIDSSPWQENATFHTTTKILKTRLRHSDNNLDLSKLAELIDAAYERFVSALIQEAGDNDRIYITFRNPVQERELYVCFYKRNFDRTEFLNRAYKLAQSAGNFLDDNVMEVKVQIVKAIAGSGQRVSKLLPGSIRAGRKTSVMVIKNNGDECGYLAIACGKYYADKIARKGTTDEWKYIRKSLSRQTKLAGNLFTDLNIDVSAPMDINKLAEIQGTLSNYQIVLVDQKSCLKLYSGPTKAAKIILEYDNSSHYNLITSISGYMECNEFCLRCWIKLAGKNHFCKDSCSKCNTYPPCLFEREVNCESCNVEFSSDQCLQNHKDNNVCTAKVKCRTCWIIHPTKEKHVCDVYTCHQCSEQYTHSPHYCFMKPLNFGKLQEEDAAPRFIICYDIESMQVPLQDSQLLHRPNLLISSTLCNSCYNDQTFSRSDNECEKCGLMEHVYYGESCVKEFCDYLYNDIAPKAKKFKARVFIFAHNQRGYDGHFIMQDFFARDFQAVPNLIMSGSKILFCNIENLRFIDSLGLFMQPLSSLCKSFNISEFEKGIFPHLFNLPANQNYVGPMPDEETFDPKSMKPGQLEEFRRWYAEAKARIGSNYNFKSELIKYCRDDVKILSLSIMKFINSFINITGLNPIVRRFTLASIALEIFRASMLPPKALAITPIAGYSRRNQSIKASAWLDSQEMKFNKTINREYRLGNFFADGYIPDTRTVFEFFGCYFHGCPMCYPDPDREIKMDGAKVKIGYLYSKVEKKKQYYKHRGYSLVEIWEHDYDALSSDDEYIRTRATHYRKIRKVGHINIRDSFFGGRTNNIKFYHSCQPGERIRYLDFTSLYPYVLKEYAYPMGHPELIEKDFKNIEEYFGFISCRVLPPGNLNIAVLPLRLNNKLIFPLCAKCAIESNPLPCSHTDEERCMTNTWTSLELQEAIKYGYKVIEIYQVLQYERKENCSIFAEYIRMWLKIKQEASGWPSWSKTEVEKQKYIDEYFAYEGIHLDPGQIEKNPGRRSIAKLMLNSFWGKLAQGVNLPKTNLIRNYADLWNIVNDESKEVLGIHEPSENVVIVQHKSTESETLNQNPGQTNIAVASFVTAYARRELFRKIQEIEGFREGRVLYFDTDSIVFVEKEGDPEITCGDYLGQLTDEIDPGWMCTSFVTLGPKNYGYETRGPGGESKVTLKVKGLKLTSAALNIINIQKLVGMAQNYIQHNKEELHVDQSNIVSNKFTHIVKTRHFKKVYRAVSEKRRICGNDTRPYGYK